MSIPLHRKLVAETIGTFCLVFAGTTAIVANGSGVVTHVGVALVFGLIVFAMIATVGDVSGAHLNPAVTIGFHVAQRLPRAEVLPYVLAQCGGALAASGCVAFLFPGAADLGATVPSGPLHQAWLLEVLLTAVLMFVILGVSTGAREKGITAGLAVGGTVALAALLGGPISGASMNPARTLGPAVLMGQLDTLWLYVTAPVMGALLAVVACRVVQAPGCCTACATTG